MPLTSQFYDDTHLRQQQQQHSRSSSNFTHQSDFEVQNYSYYINTAHHRDSRCTVALVLYDRDRQSSYVLGASYAPPKMFYYTMYIDLLLSCGNSFFHGAFPPNCDARTVVLKPDGVWPHIKFMKTRRNIGSFLSAPQGLRGGYSSRLSASCQSRPAGRCCS